MVDGVYGGGLATPLDPDKPRAECWSTPAPVLTPAAAIASVKATPSAKTDEHSAAASALMLIANEADLELSDLDDSASFANLGVNSLMSLVVSEKFRTELDVKVSGSLFLDCPTIGDLKAWLEEYYS